MPSFLMKEIIKALTVEKMKYNSFSFKVSGEER